jgi:hypothetical protein
VYLIEWFAWQEHIAGKRRAPLSGGKPMGGGKRLRKRLEEDEQRREELNAQRHNEAYLTGPVYACNDTYLEMRCGAFEHLRGMTTLISLVCVGFLSFYLYLTLLDTVLDPKDFDFWDIPFSIFTGCFSIGGFYLYFRYLFRFQLLESFTTRHLLIRFNRVTRQVYLHRPKCCGGVIVMPWEGIHHDFPGSSAPMEISWDRQDGEYGFPVTVAMVGRPVDRIEDHYALWEYIRRYMDEGGLQAVRPPLGFSMQGPWPWVAFMPQFEGLGLFFRGMSPLLWWLFVILFPAYMVLGLGHWISLLLCWKPRWPKEIREAGLPGKPAPKITMIDDYPPKIMEQLKANAYRWKAPPPEPEEMKLENTRIDKNTN